jgi:NitT/TauT family transport system ATP-binding protein
MSPTEGAIYCDDRLVRGPGPDRGVVFQDLGLLPWRTVRRNIAHGLEIQRVDRKTRDDTVARFVSLMGLSGFEDTYPHQLSGGMRQRVAVARTWAASPKVVLMDEPFAAVDAQTRITLQEELLRISMSSKATLFLITHNVDEAVFLGDRVIVMSKRPGRIKLTLDVPVPRADRSLDQLSHGEMARTTEQVLEAVREEVRVP